jgi:biopolymer transport protein ExbD
MAHAPSGRNHRVKPDTELNLVPMIDMVTNLMFFLMMFASIVPVVMIDAPLPKIASTAEEVKKAKDDQNKLELNLFINKNGLELKSGALGNKSWPVGADGKYPFDDLHKYLVQIHEKRPNDKEITLMPADDVAYDVMVQVMDASRELIQGDAGYQVVPPDIAQKPESMQFNRLFPEVSIGGV